MALTLDIPGDLIQLTGNPVWVKVSGGVQPALTSDYKYLLKITSTDGSIEGSPFTDAISPDKNGEAWFNISGIVDIPAKPVFQYPTAGVYTSYDSPVFKVKVQAGESWVDEDGVLQVNWGPESSDFQLLKGGLHPRQIGIMNDTSSTYYKTYVQSGRWLTARPWGDFVHPAQPVKLWFLPDKNQSVNFKVYGKYTDGTEVTKTTAVSLSTGNIYEFNCNPANSGIDVEVGGERLRYFDVSLEGIHTAHRFNIDWRYCERPHYLFFTNSLGGIEDVYLSGRLTEGLKADGDVVYRQQERDASQFEPTLITPNRSGQTEWVINTGHKLTGPMRYLRDLLISRRVWLLYPNLNVTSYRVVPVLITAGDLELVDYMNDIYSVDISIQEAHNSPFTFDTSIY